MWSILADSTQYHGAGGGLGGAIITVIIIWCFWPKDKGKK